MLGAIIGDIVGSRFEYDNHKSKRFELFSNDCAVTDDSIMTIAVKEAVVNHLKTGVDLTEETVKKMREYGKRYPNPYGDYGFAFKQWLNSKNPKPYNSFGNGSAMRVSACGELANSLEEAKRLSYLVTVATHNHIEGIKGAEAVAVSIYLAKQGKNKEEIREHILKNYYNIDFTLDELRNYYEFDVTCQGTVPQALQAFFESANFEDAIRNAISIGGDSDTIGAITGSIAEVYYGIPKQLKDTALNYLDKFLLNKFLTLDKY